MLNIYSLYFEDNKPVENAGFLLRLFATIVDLMIIFFLSYVILIVVKFSLLFVIVILYFPILESNSYYQGSFGKKMFRLKVVNSTGKTLTYYEAFTRLFAKILSLVLFGVGFFMIIFSRDKLALHDKLTNTYVKVKYE